MSTELVIVFTRYPEAGRTKTRLIPELGPEGAAELQRQMTEHIVRRLLASRAEHPLSVMIRYDGGDPYKIENWLGDGLVYRPQTEGDLGDRLRSAFCDAFAEGNERAVAIGTDCPALAKEHIAQAFQALLRADVVLGPTSDGGYYLVGISGNRSDAALDPLFRSIDWGTEVVLQQTVERLDADGVSYELLETLDDIDRPEDLHVWERIRRCQ